VFNLLSAYAFLYLLAILRMPSVSAEDGDDRDGKFRFLMWGFGGVCAAAAALCISADAALYRAGSPWPRPGALVSAGAMVYFLAFFFASDRMRLARKELAMLPLVVYAVIQLAWGRDADVLDVALGLALVFKLYLFGLVAYLMSPRSARGHGCERPRSRLADYFESSVLTSKMGSERKGRATEM